MEIIHIVKQEKHVKSGSNDLSSDQWPWPRSSSLTWPRATSHHLRYHQHNKKTRVGPYYIKIIANSGHSTLEDFEESEGFWRLSRLWRIFRTCELYLDFDNSGLDLSSNTWILRFAVSCGTYPCLCVCNNYLMCW